MFCPRFRYTISSVDVVRKQWNYINVGVVIDDVQLLAVGASKQTERETHDAAQFVISDLATKGLTVDLTDRKLVILASNAASARELKKKIAFNKTRGRSDKKCIATVARNLGVDYSLLRRSVTVQKERLRTARRRATRLACVRKAGASAAKVASLLRSGATSVALYGSGVVGLSDSALAEARAIAHRSLLPSLGNRSATADFCFAAPGAKSPIDPAVEACVSPIQCFARAFQEEWVPKEVLAKLSPWR